MHRMPASQCPASTPWWPVFSTHRAPGWHAVQDGCCAQRRMSGVDTMHRRACCLVCHHMTSVAHTGRHLCGAAGAGQHSLHPAAGHSNRRCLSLDTGLGCGIALRTGWGRPQRLMQRVQVSVPWATPWAAPEQPSPCAAASSDSRMLLRCGEACLPWQPGALQDSTDPLPACWADQCSGTAWRLGICCCLVVASLCAHHHTVWCGCPCHALEWRGGHFCVVAQHANIQPVFAVNVSALLVLSSL